LPDSLCPLYPLYPQYPQHPLYPLYPLPYDTWPYEFSALSEEMRPWGKAELVAELKARIQRAKEANCVEVNYYRIGYRFAFPLPVKSRPAGLPAEVGSIKSYPWMTWLSWELENRWRLLYAAWRHFQDMEASRLLQEELAALSEWDNYREVSGEAGLVTAHLAAVLAMVLRRPESWESWDSGLYQKVEKAARKLLNNDILPWYRRVVTEKPQTLASLHNIPLITLFRGAQLAETLGVAEAGALQNEACRVLQVWCRRRLAQHHTEGASYDGYLFDSITEWLDPSSLPISAPGSTPSFPCSSSPGSAPGSPPISLPHRLDLWQECRPAFEQLCRQWLHLSLPGRLHIQAPLGDTEQEMPFWMTALLRMTWHYGWKEAGRLLRHIPVSRLPSAAIIEALDKELDKELDMKLDVKLAASPDDGLMISEHAGAVTMRTGWQLDDALVVVGLSRAPMGHLHHDGGNLILGWRGRFWITDPGYQQYRAGDERQYTLGISAHNAPVINGIAQTRRVPILQQLLRCPDGGLQVTVDLSRNYEGLPPSASVQRIIWLFPGEEPLVRVQDRFSGLPPGTKIETYWHGGAHLAWSYIDGWIRLSSGREAVWLKSWPQPVDLTNVFKHPGSRGPLTLHHTAILTEGAGDNHWIFRGDPADGIAVPSHTPNSVPEECPDR